MRIVSIVGARPQFVKAATVSRALRGSAGVCEWLVHTGQHYDCNMSEVFFKDLDIPEPKYNLGIGSARHGAQTGRMLEAIESVLLEELPDWVLVYGDTNSTVAGALAAAKLHVPVAHVEAGLRSFNRAMPEEINRVLTDHASDLLFAPTGASVRNLEREGISGERVRLVGDVMYDAALYYQQDAKEQSRILASLSLEEGKYILATVHRAENTDDLTRLRAIVGALATVSEETCVVLPIHPRTRQAIDRIGWGTVGNLRVIDPVGYLDMVMLEGGARLIATDSGGVQKEAFFFRVPCVTLRDETEWVELLDTGWNRLIPPRDETAIIDGIKSFMREGPPHERPNSLYGDGNAATAIVQQLISRK